MCTGTHAVGADRSSPACHQEPVGSGRPRLSAQQPSAAASPALVPAAAAPATAPAAASTSTRSSFPHPHWDTATRALVPFATLACLADVALRCAAQAAAGASLAATDAWVVSGCATALLLPCLFAHWPVTRAPATNHAAAALAPSGAQPPPSAAWHAHPHPPLQPLASNFVSFLILSSVFLDDGEWEAVACYLAGLAGTLLLLAQARRWLAAATAAAALDPRMPGSERVWSG